MAKALEAAYDSFHIFFTFFYIFLHRSPLTICWELASWRQLPVEMELALAPNTGASTVAPTLIDPAPNQPTYTRREEKGGPGGERERGGGEAEREFFVVAVVV